MNRENIMEFFRKYDILEQLSRDDLQEIALHCCSYNDDIYRILESSIRLYNDQCIV